MRLDERIKRRDFLELAAKAAGMATIGSIPIINSACKGGETTGPPKPVTLSFDVYNHTQGLRGSFTKTAMSGDNINLKINELNVNNVDQQRMAVREDGFGGLITFSSAGEANFTAPNASKGYDIILFNQLGTDVLGRQVSYSWMDDKSSTLYLGKRNYVIYRKDRDGVTGPEESWQSVFSQLNSALNLGWVNWGSITTKPAPNDGTGDFSYGYGICYVGGRRVDGLHGGSIILVDPQQCPTETGRRAVGLAEAFENICSVADIGGYSSLMTIQNQGVLSQTGKDLFAYIFAKDGASRTSARSKFSVGFF